MFIYIYIIYLYFINFFFKSTVTNVDENVTECDDSESVIDELKQKECSDRDNIKKGK